jgi:hypothetical protein
MNPGARKDPQLSLIPPSPRKRSFSPAPGASWEVKARATRCRATEQDFEEGELICSRLVDGPGGLEREDYSAAAWSPELAAGARVHWKLRFRKPAPRKEAPFKEEDAEETFRELLSRNDPSVTNTVYILALMLERKRMLIDRGDVQDVDGTLLRVYDHKESGETFFIPDPRLELDRIPEVQREVALQLGWIQEEAPADPPAESPAEPEKNSHGEIDNPGPPPL